MTRYSGHIGGNDSIAARFRQNNVRQRRAARRQVCRVREASDPVGALFGEESIFRGAAGKLRELTAPLVFPGVHEILDGRISPRRFSRALRWMQLFHGGDYSASMGAVLPSSDVPLADDELTSFRLMWAWQAAADQKGVRLIELFPPPYARALRGAFIMGAMGGTDLVDTMFPLSQSMASMSSVSGFYGFGGEMRAVLKNAVELEEDVASRLHLVNHLIALLDVRGQYGYASELSAKRGIELARRHRRGAWKEFSRAADIALKGACDDRLAVRERFRLVKRAREYSTRELMHMPISLRRRAEVQARHARFVRSMDSMIGEWNLGKRIRRPCRSKRLPTGDVSRAAWEFGEESNWRGVSLPRGVALVTWKAPAMRVTHQPFTDYFNGPAPSCRITMR